MSGKKKIAIVAGELELPRLLKLFEPLTALGDVTVYAFSRPKLMENYRLGLKLRLFEPVNEMPGFMRGLDAELVDSDLIIGLESSKLSSFQALRIALRERCPFICFVTESLPFMYSAFTNIRAIQEDIFRNAAGFWTLSDLAATSLTREGVSRDRISVLSPVIDRSRFKFDMARREKFRRHIGLSDDSIVCMYQAPMVESACHLEVIRALDYLRRCGSAAFSRFRIVFAGIGPSAQDLKYRCVDLGLSQQVLFLHQDPEPFAQDLYAAVDAVIAGPMGDLELSSTVNIPLPIFEAHVAGACPITIGGTVAGEVLSDVTRALPAFTFQNIGEEFLKILNEFSTISVTERPRPIAAKLESNPASILASATAVLDLSKKESGEDIRSVIGEIDKSTKQGREKDSLVRIEDMLLRGVVDLRDRSEVYRAKGDALYSTGQYEEAMNSYSDAAHLNERNLAAFRGLGYVAWSSHSNEDALTFFRKALAINDNDPRTLLGIGLVFRRVSLFEESIFWLERAVDHEEVRNTALSGLLQACSDAPRPQLAIAALNRVLEVVGDKPSVLVTLGQIYINSGNTDEGNRLLAKAAA